MECKYLTNGVRINEDGTVVPCCVFNGNIGIKYSNNFDFKQYLQSPKLHELKSQLAEGIWPDGCSSCKNREELKLVSYRMRGNLEINGNVVDVVIGKECNSDCVMCYAGQSSKISSRLQHNKPSFNVPAEDQYWINNVDFNTNWANDSKLWENLLELFPSIERFKFLGGEPLLNKNLWQWLDSNIVKADKNKKTIEIITNGSIANDKLELLGGWKKSIITLSVDAYGTEYEWIRHGLSWQQLNNNIMQFKNIKGIVAVHIAISMYSITTIPALLEWIKTNKLTFSITPVISPSLLALRNTPKDILEEVLLELQGFTFDEMQNKVQLTTIKNLIKDSISTNTENPQLREQITDYFNKHRRHEMDWKTLRCMT